MKSALCLLLVSVALGLCLPALAAWQTHAGIGLQIWVPDDWKQEADEDTLTVRSPDENVAVVYVMLAAQDLKAATQALDQEIGVIIKNPKISTKPKETTIKGVRGMFTEGTGTVTGAQVDWSVAIYSHKDRCLLILGFGESGKAKKHAKEIEKMLTSIKKA
jgi:hypothetical protein